MRKLHEAPALVIAFQITKGQRPLWPDAFKNAKPNSKEFLVKTLIETCWVTDPKQRPPIPFIRQKLIEIEQTQETDLVFYLLSITDTKELDCRF